MLATIESRFVVFTYLSFFFTFLYSFLKGDIFIVHNDMGDGWLWCTLHRTQESGLVFKELVEELVSVPKLFLSLLHFLKFIMFFFAIFSF